MKMLRKFVSMLCLFSLSAALELGALAQQAAPAQPSAPAAPAAAAAPAPATGATSTPAADLTFHGVKLADAKGKQAEAFLTLSDANKKLVVHSADRDVVAIPYDQLDKFSYEYTKKHRVTQGAIVMVASLGAGAIVMLTKSKSHWLYIDFHEQNAPKSIVLRMDKGEYKDICRAVAAHTGKQVEFFNDAADKSKSKTEKNESQGPGE